MHRYLGHPGIVKEYLTIREYYNIKNIFEIIKRNNYNCYNCSKYKHKAKEHRITYGNLIAKEKFDKISMDIIGPYKCSKFKTSLCKTNFYLLVMTDIFSRYTSIGVLKDLRRETVIEIFTKKWIKEFNCPRAVLTDLGKPFINKKFENFHKIQGIKHIQNTAYNPEGNGVSERVNREINVLMRLYKGAEIFRIIKRIKRRLNLCAHSTTKKAPQEIIYKYNRIDPLKRNLEIDSKEIYKRITLAAEKNKAKMRKKEIPYEFKSGDIVLLKNHKQLKTASVYKTPCFVKKISKNKNSLLLEKIYDKGNIAWVNVKNVRILRGEIISNKFKEIYLINN